MIRFYAAMVFASFSIAIGFAVQGAWLILPFAGLEMLVLGVALYQVARGNTRWQAVSVGDDHIEITDHFPGGGQQSFQRAWARVELKQPAIKGYPTGLTIGSHGRIKEIGRCLNEYEKKHLAHELRKVLRPAH